MSEIKTNKISSLDSSNSDITIDPDGTGKVYVPSQLDVEAATGDATLRVHAAEADSSSEPILVLESSNDFAESVVEFKDSSGVGGRIAYNHGDNALRFQTNGLSERMRITSGGDTLFGTTTGSIDSSNFGVVCAGDGSLLNSRNVNGANTTTRHYGNAGEMRVYGDGDVQNTNNSYGAISDISVKSDIVDASSQWDDIKNVRFRNYTLNETGATHLGVIAQEIETVSPMLVKTDSEGLKSVKYSILYMKAVKALQEAIAKIEALETSNADLEARVTALENA